MMEREGSDNLDNLVDNNKKPSLKNKIILIIIALIIISVIVIIIVLVASSGKDDDKSDSSKKFKVSINTVNMPEGITYGDHAIYSKKGRILFFYYKENDNKTYIGVMNEDGTNLTELWSGEWKAFYHSNGIRLMPFEDNKKILTGDYILECFPDIDNCQNSTLLLVIYPPEVLNLEGLYFVWSEIIVSPDEHIGWTTLSTVFQAINFLGKLEKNENNYTISNIQVISTLGFIEYENEKEGIFKYTTLRGGEIKQFTNGGEALTLVGAGDSALAKSIFQNLVGEENYPLTHFPGYDETTIISPDGKLGLVMTTRFSLKTSSYILGYMPRPLSVYTVSNINQYVYLYGVTEVRKKREGNIGPALINIEESKKNSSYMGYDLHEEGWAFVSPLSWHPNSKKGIFSEIKKNSEKEIKRIRIVNLENYEPGKKLENKKTPDNISYAKTLDDLNSTSLHEVHGYFKGKGGIMIFNKTATWTKSEYINYTDDDKTFYNGYEKFEYVGNQLNGKLTSNITMSGEKKGIMDLTLTMTLEGNILFNQSYGYVEYNGKKITLEDSFVKE